MCKEEKICGIYKITNSINGKCYIGQSTNIQRRWKEHKKLGYKENICTILYEAINKYGVQNFKFEILEECGKEQLDEKEVIYVKYFNSYVGFPNSNGYNMTLGGNSGKGYVPSKELRNAWSKNRSGSGNGMALPVVCDEKEFPTIKECASYYGVEKTSMQKWLQCVVGMPEFFVEKQLRYKNSLFCCKEYHKNRGIEFIYNNKEFNSISECATYYNMSPEGMRKRLKRELVI